MSDHDQIQRILFDQRDIRGVLTGLDNTYRDALANHDYPPVIRRLLGEMMAAAAILSANLKFEGRLILQAQGSGAVQMLMAESTHEQKLRAIARFDAEQLDENVSFTQLLKGGALAITIMPLKGQRYQGYVPLEGENLSDCLEAYFRYSEQLNSQLHLACDGEKAAGFLLQVLPAEGGKTEDWNHLSQLGATLKTEELLELDNQTLLYRLFHEEDCRLHEASPVLFYCDCSRERTLASLRFMSEEELHEIAASEGHVEVGCQFCGEAYYFDAADITALFSATGQAPGSEATH
ncbi:MAG: Hsp33 family molecular chaperone HslO [Marinobacterium sp.]|nr:Hsp33 family molecular chaperone HslO [Marinobacterium sp.]